MGIGAAIANVPDGVGVVYDAAGNTDTIQVVNFGTLVYTGPIDVSLTLDRIRRRLWLYDIHPGTLRHFNDGVVFNPDPQRDPGVYDFLPVHMDGYYHEFVYWPFIDLDAGTYDPHTPPFDDPSVIWPGPMRLLLGANGEVYFSGDHYASAYYVNPTGPGGGGAGVTANPEPSTLILFIIGAAGLFGFWWRRQRAA
jgi:hypothetical protein